MTNRYPRRLVCLTEETVETLHLLGCLDRVVGVSGFAVRPKQVRKLPRVSSFLAADVPAILALKPDLVLCFSDLQSDIAAALMKAGVEVVGFNQRTLEEVYRAMLLTGALVGKNAEAEALVERMEARVAAAVERARKRPRLRVYFEEWGGPLISAIGWVSELLTAAGGDDIFPEKARGRGGAERIVLPEDVIARDPQVIIGSWCGKMFKPDRLRARPGFDAITAVRRNALHEVKSTLILQPGPAALTDGLDALEQILEAEAARA